MHTGTHTQRKSATFLFQQLHLTGHHLQIHRSCFPTSSLPFWEISFLWRFGDLDWATPAMSVPPGLYTLSPEALVSHIEKRIFQSSGSPRIQQNQLSVNFPLMAERWGINLFICISPTFIWCRLCTNTLHISTHVILINTCEFVTTTISHGTDEDAEAQRG